eukprot:NODE_16052_length_1014_cov_8.224352.p2 GENE.NODE_16052_length_1014_cov_8.224352~~NODE_16052_length_1014_cov_8.224352.p2  ORF type:complete len:216 (+),score=66.50 NODE_16052_length_1014_cov_8.224352:286-933(+)
MALAMDINICEVMDSILRMFTDQNTRVGGYVGAYSSLVRGTMEVICAAAGGASAFKRANGRLEVYLTALAPHPKLAVVTEYSSNENLMQTILGSCYAPVVFEEPILLPEHGLVLDGAIANFRVNGNLVVGPYHSGMPDIGPKEEFSRQLVFKPVDGRDLLRLFEDGWRDAAVWAAAGSPQNGADRRQSSGTGFTSLIGEGLALALEVVGLKNKPV